MVEISTNQFMLRIPPPFDHLALVVCEDSHILRFRIIRPVTNSGIFA
jgi:hypothetical protein